MNGYKYHLICQIHRESKYTKSFDPRSRCFYLYSQLCLNVVTFELDGAEPNVDCRWGAAETDSVARNVVFAFKCATHYYSNPTQFFPSHFFMRLIIHPGKVESVKYFVKYSFTFMSHSLDLRKCTLC